MSVFLGANNCVTALGFDTKLNFDSLVAGKMALKKLRFPFSTEESMCAKIEEVALDKELSAVNVFNRFTLLEKMCLLSITNVIENSDIDFSNKDTLLILSTTKGNIDVLEKKYSHIPDNRQYLHVFANVIGEHFNCTNQPLLISNACISGLLSIIVAKRLIENKLFNNVVVCGADLVTEFTLSGFTSFNALSTEACKPFDKMRKGINLGEAAACILLSAKEISNIVVEAGASANDANHISGPSRNGEGLFQAISNSISDCSIKTFDFISAHGTATDFNDEMESVAFSRLNLHHLPVHSLKGYFGHTLGAAGVLESIIAIECLKQDTLLASKGYNVQGTSHLDNIIKKTEKKSLQTCLKTASGFGGCNAAVVFKKI